MIRPSCDDCSVFQYQAQQPFFRQSSLYILTGYCISRLLDDYLVMFRKQVDERKTWIAVSENRMSSSYLEIEDLPGFQKELKEHKVK